MVIRGFVDNGGLVGLAITYWVALVLLKLHQERKRIRKEILDKLNAADKKALEPRPSKLPESLRLMVDNNTIWPKSIIAEAERLEIEAHKNRPVPHELVECHKCGLLTSPGICVFCQEDYPEQLKDATKAINGKPYNKNKKIPCDCLICHAERTKF